MVKQLWLLYNIVHLIMYTYICRNIHSIGVLPSMCAHETGTTSWPQSSWFA